MEYLKDEKMFDILYENDNIVEYSSTTPKNLKRINNIIYNLPEIYTTFTATKNQNLYIIEIKHNFKYEKLLQDKTISLEDFKSKVDTFIEYLIQTIKKINNIIDSNEKVKFNTESFKERLNTAQFNR